MKHTRFFALFLAVLLAALLPAQAFAASESETAAADTLYELGLFAGTGKNADGSPVYSLDRSMTRQEAMTMFVNLLGKGKEAVDGTWETPFTDVDDWAKPFVGYAYENGLTAGVAADRFGAKDTVTRTQYLTYVLTALGYEQGKDFTWDKAESLAWEIGLGEGLVGGNFTRGNAVLVSYRMLAEPYKGSDACMLGTFEGKPANALLSKPLGTGFVFNWQEKDTWVTAYYGADATLKDRYEGKAFDVPFMPEQLILEPWDGGSSSAGYYCSARGLFRLQEGRLVRLSSRPVAQMIFTRVGAGSSDPIILTFDSKAPVFSSYQRFGGNTILEIGKDGSETVLLHGNTGHGIEIDKIWAMDSVVHFCAAEDVGQFNLNEYTYALLSVLNEATGKYRPSVVVVDYKAGRPETEEGWSETDPASYKVPYIQAEQQRLNDLGIGIE